MSCLVNARFLSILLRTVKRGGYTSTKYPLSRFYATAAAVGHSEPPIIKQTSDFDHDLHWGSAFPAVETSEFDENTEDTTAQSNSDHGDREDSRLVPSKNATGSHIPVLCREVMDCFWRLESLGERAPVFLDMTFGAGGHSAALLETFPDCTIYALDRDPLAAEFIAPLQEKFPDRLIPLTGRFSQLPSLLSNAGVKKPFDGILLDAGCSSMQMDREERGFAISRPDAPLDMRMEGVTSDSTVTAADVVNRIDEENLGNIFRKYGEDKRSKQIARAIVENRFMMKKFYTTGDLAAFVAQVVGGDGGTDGIGRRQHPATKIFQALRIFINDELNELDYAMSIGHSLLRPRGIFAAITFHSMECKIVKEQFHSADWRDRLRFNAESPQLSRLYRNHARFLPRQDVLDTMQFQWMRLSKKAIQPTQHEIDFNPRCRSAKLRAALKLDV